MTMINPSNPTQQVFEWVLARQVAPPDLHHGRLVHVQWSAPRQADRFVQLYVDGSLCGITTSPSSREAWLLLDAAIQHCIELLAVDPTHAATPAVSGGLANESSLHAATGFALRRDASLPIDSRVVVELDGQPLDTTLLFPPDTPRGGFGAVFGEGGFGYDASTGPGLGRGELGYGPLGIDGDTLRWRHAALAEGDHAVRIKLVGDEGSAIAPEVTFEPSITALPSPPSGVTLQPDLTLSWT